MALVQNIGKIKSFVVLDLETSGLHSRARITEIGLVAACRDHIHDASESNVQLPRVLHKLNLCVYPSRQVDDAAYRVSGLDNLLLQEQKPFDSDVFSILECFLRRLPSPICLVAHNGDRFDFPVLRAELGKLGKDLPDDMLCADTLKYFKEFFARKNTCNELDDNGMSGVGPQQTEPRLISFNEVNHNSINIGSDLGIYPLARETQLDDEFDEALCNTLECLESKSFVITAGVKDSTTLANLIEDDGAANSVCVATLNGDCGQSNSLRTGMGTDLANTFKAVEQCEPSKGGSPVCGNDVSFYTCLQKQNETTPKTGIRNNNTALRKSSKSVAAENSSADKSYTNTVAAIRKRTARNCVHGVRKRLTFDGPSLVEGGARPKSFKLTDIYEFLHGVEPSNAHTADGDALNLLRCIVKFGNDFLEWTDINGHRLCDVVPRR